MPCDDYCSMAIGWQLQVYIKRHYQTTTQLNSYHISIISTKNDWGLQSSFGKKTDFGWFRPKLGISKFYREKDRFLAKNSYRWIFHRHFQHLVLFLRLPNEHFLDRQWRRIRFQILVLLAQSYLVTWIHFLPCFAIARAAKLFAKTDLYCHQVVDFLKYQIKTPISVKNITISHFRDCF